MSVSAVGTFHCLICINLKLSYYMQRQISKLVLVIIEVSCSVYIITFDKAVNILVPDLHFLAAKAEVSCSAVMQICSILFVAGGGCAQHKRQYRLDSV